MSEQTAQSMPVSDVDASVDQLLRGGEVEDLAPSAPAPIAASAPSAPAVAVATATTSAPVAPGASTRSLDDEIAEAADPLLAQISSEIEQAAPGTLPVAPGVPSEAAFAAPSAAELAPPAASPPAANHDIDRLDHAIATDADRLLAEAQADLPPEPVRPPAPAAPPARAPAAVAPTAAPKPAPIAAPVAAPAHVEAHPAPATVEVIITESVKPAASIVDGKPSGANPFIVAITAGVSTALRPLVELHERLGESARQTVAYCAILTMFCAACAWGMPRFMRAKELEPVTPGQEFYNETTPAHGVVAPARGKAAEGEAKGEHGGGGHGESAEGGEGHGEKKPSSSRARPERKSEPHPERRSSGRAKTAAKPEAHAGHE